MTDGSTVTLAQLKEMIGDLHISWELAKARAAAAEFQLERAHESIARLREALDEARAPVKSRRKGV